MNRLILTALLMLNAIPVFAQESSTVGDQRVPVAAGIDVRNAYMFRGVRQDDTGTITWPSAEVGLRLHAARFPSTRHGLGAIEARTMEIIAAGAHDFGAIFETFNTDEPRYGFGDAQLYRLLWRLVNVAVPMLTIGNTIGTPIHHEAAAAHEGGH